MNYLYYFGSQLLESGQKRRENIIRRSRSISVFLVNTNYRLLDSRTGDAFFFLFSFLASRFIESKISRKQLDSHRSLRKYLPFCRNVNRIKHKPLAHV